MEGLNLTHSGFWTTVIIGFLIVGVVNVLLQYQNDPEQINQKAIVRDGILGAIFTAMAWTLAPETMESLASKVVSTTKDTTHSIISGGSSFLESSSSLGEIDLHVGPPRF